MKTRFSSGNFTVKKAELKRKILSNTSYRLSLVLEWTWWTVVQRFWCSIKSFQMTQGVHEVILILPIKTKRRLLLRSSVSFDFFIHLFIFFQLILHLTSFKVRVNYYKFGIRPKCKYGIHSNLNLAHHFIIHWLLQNGRNTNQN